MYYSGYTYDAVIGMAPKGTFTAPKVWKRPKTAIYNDNYRFGNSLYSGAVADLERKYSERNPYIASYSPPPTSDPGTRRAILEAELGLHTADLHSRSLSASRASQRATEAISNYSLSSLKETTTTTTSSLASRPQVVEGDFSSYASHKALASMEQEIEESRARRRRRTADRRPGSAYFASDAGNEHHISYQLAPQSAGANAVAAANIGEGQNFWMERCRELTSEINGLSNQLAESEDRIKSESSNLKNKLNMDVTDLVLVLDEQDRVTQELVKTLKCQKRQIEDLQLNVDAGQTRYHDTLETIEDIKRKANQLCRDVDAIRLSGGK